jgi:hypothetical protein
MGFVAVMVAVGPPEAQAQGPDDLDALNHQVVQLFQSGKYAAATEIAKKSLALAERKFGPYHPQVADPLNNLAELYSAQGSPRPSRSPSAHLPSARRRSAPIT